MNLLLWLKTCILFLSAGASIASADVTTFSGTLNPATNPNLTYWDQLANAYAAPIPGPTDAERAFNIAVHTFPVVAAGPVTIASQGYGLGGFDSVVSFFQGTGFSAAYLHHGYSPSLPGDFSFGLKLGIGDYTLAISMFGSEPCAAGLCVGSTGTFGDGFNNLVNFNESRYLSYQVEVTTAPIPEPASFGLLMSGIVALLLRRRFRQRG